MQLPFNPAQIKPFLLLLPSDARDKALALLRIAERVKNMRVVRNKSAVSLKFLLEGEWVSVLALAKPAVIDAVLSEIGITIPTEKFDPPSGVPV